MAIDGLWSGAWPTTAPQLSSKLRPVTVPSARQPAIFGNGMAVVHHLRLAPNGSFFHATIAFLRIVEAAESAPARARAPHNGEKATDNPHRQPTAVQGALVAPITVVPWRRRGKPRRRGAVPDHRKPKWN